jgi:hypothetical protein
VDGESKDLFMQFEDQATRDTWVSAFQSHFSYALQCFDIDGVALADRAAVSLKLGVPARFAVR